MRYVIVLLFLLLGAQWGEAQIVERTKDRAEQKANNRVDRRIDQGIDKGLDTIEGLFKKKKKSKDKTEKTSENTSKEAAEESSESDEVPNLGGLFGGKADVKESYAFQHEVKMQIESTDKKGKASPVQHMSIYLSDDSPDMGIETEIGENSALMVMDLEKLIIVTLVDQGGQKIGITAKLDDDLLQDEPETTDQTEFRKTGRTKTIAGYSCEEYVSEDDDYSYEIWVTQEADFDVEKAFGGMAGMKQAPTTVSPNTPKGLMMEMWGTSKKNEKEKVHVLVTEVNKNQPNQISTTGYTFLGR